MRSGALAALTALTVALAFGSWAASWAAATEKAPAADMELGRHLSAECMSCHRAAHAGGAIPDIFGHEPTTFVTVMKAYRDKHLPNEAMQTIAGRLNDEDIASLALYFATAKK